MDKVSFELPQVKWGTLKSKYAPESRYVNSDELTAGSYNFVTNVDGSLTKRPTDVLYNPAALSSVGTDQFEAIFSSGVHHLLMMVNGTLKYTTGDGTVSTAKSGFTAAANMEYSMYQNRVYFCNGVDNAGVYDLTTSYGGVSYTFPSGTIKDMGCQVPVAAPTFAADSGTGLTGSYHYIVTFLYYGFEESNGGPASALHTVTNKTINLTGIPTGGYGVTARKIYRDANDGNYLLVGTISDNTTTTFADSLSAGTTPIPTANNLPPVFKYVALNLSRLWVAGVSGTPTTLYWSNPGLPDIFDPTNSILCNPKDPIQAVAVYQGITYVFNRHSFGRILGTTDDSFYYDEFPGSVGCIDGRTIQVRTIDGVPTLLWLSDRGFYSFNGSSADYISDPIEDLVNFNIQQVNFVSGSNSQSSQADFQAGTATAGIDLTSNPGEITTVNPTKTFQAEADWEGGSSLTNIATADGSNQLKVPTAFSTTLAAGTLSGSAQSDGTNLTLPTIVDFTGDINYSTPLSQSALHNISKLATSFTLVHAATVTQAAMPGIGMSNAHFYIYSNGLSQPGSQVADFGTGGTGSVDLAAGTYWIVVTGTAQSSNTWNIGSRPLSGGLNNGMFFNPNDGFWSSVGSEIVAASFTCTQDAVASSGSWSSRIYDSASIGSTATDVVINTGSFPTSCSGTLYVDMSNDATMGSGVTTFSQANPNGTYSPALSGKRYWRLRYDISTTDNRRTPSVTVPSLRFSTTGTWISPAIDCTTDVTSYNALTVTDNIPSGTSVAFTIATSADNVTYTAYTTVGSAVVQRYVKVKIVLTTSSDNSNTPSVSLLTFSWNLSSTFTSSIINVGQVPSGWGLFQDVAAAGAGTITLYMRSASSSGGISSATFVAVTNGSFPGSGVSPLQYVQWKAVITAGPGVLPTIDSVTINWFLGNNQSPIRTASLFFSRTYYCSAAENNQTVNNIVISYDQEGNWRLFRNLNINSMGLFFNQPFYLDAVRPNLYQWLVSANGMGTAITMDVRTKAFDLAKDEVLKIVRGLWVTGINTGTTIHAYYSVDRGTTWIEMLNSHGATGLTTTSALSKFTEYFVPDFTTLASGTVVMFRVTSTDAFPCSVLKLKPDLYIRKGKYLGRPT